MLEDRAKKCRTDSRQGDPQFGNRFMVIAYPDRAKTRHKTAQHLNIFKGFLYNLTAPAGMPSRVPELVEKDCQVWVSTHRYAVRIQAFTDQFPHTLDVSNGI